jgi:hypothetical protein
MPAAGTAAWPSKKARRTISKARLEVCSVGSSWMPPSRARQKRSTVAAENPASHTSMVASSARNRAAGLT